MEFQNRLLTLGIVFLSYYSSFYFLNDSLIISRHSFNTLIPSGLPT